MDKLQESLPLIDKPSAAGQPAKLQRSWRHPWYALLGNGSAEDVAACCLAWHAPCVAFGWNSSRGLQMSFLREAIRLLALFFCALALVHFGTCGVMRIACGPPPGPHHWQEHNHGHWESQPSSVTTFDLEHSKYATKSTTSTEDSMGGRHLMGWHDEHSTKESEGSHSHRGEWDWTHGSHSEGSTKDSRSDSYNEASSWDWDTMDSTTEGSTMSSKSSSSESTTEGSTKDSRSESTTEGSTKSSMSSSSDSTTEGSTRTSSSSDSSSKDSHSWGRWEHPTHSEHPTHWEHSSHMEHECMKKAAPWMLVTASASLAVLSYAIWFAARRRQLIRERFGIEGSLPKDCALWTFCSVCALSQETRTLMHEQVHHGVWHGAIPAPVMAVPAQQAFQV